MFASRWLCVALILLCLGVHGRRGLAEEVQLPRGFTALFNGQDLAGWHGRGPIDPVALQKLPEEQRTSWLTAKTAELMNQCRVEKGQIIHDGNAPVLTSNRDFGDVELRFEFRTAHAALGVCELRGTLGGIEESLHRSEAWKQMRIIQLGERRTVYSDGRLAIDNRRAINSWDGKRALPAKAPIQFFARGGEVRWRNIVVREIPGEEANRLLRAREDKGFVAVFNGRDFTGWDGPTDNYEVKDGAIVCKPKKGGNIYTKEEFSDFVARVEYRVPPGGNNGLAIRYPGKGQASLLAMCEVQVLDDDAPKYAKLDPRQYNGAAYGMLAPQRGYQRPGGEWNLMEVTVKGSTIQVELNGTRTVEGDLGKVTEFMGGKPHPGKDRTSGHFGFCGHNDPVAFRNIQIKPLTGARP